MNPSPERAKKNIEAPETRLATQEKTLDDVIKRREHNFIAGGGSRLGP